MNGTLRAHVQQRSGVSVVADLTTCPPLAAKILTGVAGNAELILIGSAAAALEGDRLDIFLTLEPGTTLTVRSSAATLAHPCPGGGSTLSTHRAVLGRGARLAWLPEPLVACAGCRHTSASTLSLEEGAAAVWYEACTLGRSGEIAGPVDLRLDVTLAGVPLLRDGFRGEAAPSPAVLGGHRHLGSIHLLGKRLPGAVPGVWDLAGPGATARCLAADAAGLQGLLEPARQQFLDALFEPSPRIVWSRPPARRRHSSMTEPHVHDRHGPEAKRALEREAQLPTRMWEREVARGLELGLQGADSIVDRNIPTFSRGELPHYAGINTFLKAPYVEDVRTCGDYDVAILGAPHDSGTTYRPGTRFGPQGMRRISALYGTYSFELGVDLRESITIADLGDVFTIPGNIEKTFDQISKAVSHVYASGALPVVLGGDHSIGYPTVRGVAEHLEGNLGIIHFDRHVDTQETDLDERMHTTPWYHATDIPNVPAKNLVQLGIGGWQAPRPGVKVCRERETTIMTVTDCVEMGIDTAADRALDVAWDGAEAVWLSFDVDCLDAAFVPGTGWPEPGGFLPREVLRLVRRVAERGLAGIEIVECSPPYDSADITSLIGVRVICDVLGTLVSGGLLPRR